MSNRWFNVPCSLAVLVAILGAPAHGQAQSISESISKLSVTDIQRVLETPEARSNQTSQATARKHSVKRNAIVGALIGLAPASRPGCSFINTATTKWLAAAVSACRLGSPPQVRESAPHSAPPARIGEIYCAWSVTTQTISVTIRAMKRICCLACVSMLFAAPAAPQVTGPVAPALTPEQIKSSESLAPKFDESAAREKARLETFINRPLGAIIQRSFNIFTNYLVMAAEMMPESGYAFRPTPDLRTFGQQINHATGAHYSFCNQAGVPPGVQKQAAPSLATITAKPAIIAALRESIAYCDRVLAAASEEWLSGSAAGLGGSSSGLIHGMRAHALIYNAVHSAEDYGTITTYMRMQGIVPPSTALHPPKK